MNSVSMRFRERLPQLRAQRGIGTTDLGRGAGVAASQISRIESGKIQSVSIDSFVSITTALGMSPPALLGELTGGEPAAVPKLIHGLSDFMEKLDPSEQESALGVLTRWQEERASSLTVAQIKCDTMPLGDILSVGRGPEVPANWIIDELPGRGKLRSPERRRYVESFVRAQQRYFRMVGGKWDELMRLHPPHVVPCFTPKHIRPFTTPTDAGGMLYPSDWRGDEESAAVFRPCPKLIVEPRTLVAMVDTTGAAIPQTLYYAVPHARPDRGRCVTEVLLDRVAAVLLTIHPASLAPGVVWLDKGFRPRLHQVQNLQLPVFIVAARGLWVAVDRVIARLKQQLLTVEPPPNADAYDRCMWWRDNLPMKSELTAAVEKAMSTR